MAEPLIVALSGKAGTGKSTCADMLVHKLTDMGVPARKCSFASVLREECSQSFPKVDFYEKPTPTPVRKLLQAWGQLRRMEDPNYWTTALGRAIVDYSGVVVIDDLRFQNEALWLRTEWTSVLIRLGCTNNPLVVPTDQSEIDLDDWDYWDAEWWFPYGNLNLFPQMAWQLIRSKDTVLRWLGAASG